jgi:hypothetical protein
MFLIIQTRRITERIAVASRPAATLQTGISPVIVVSVAREPRSGSKADIRIRAKVEVLLEEMKEVAQRVGLKVREEKLLREVGYRVRSGTCRVYDRDLVLIDRDLPVAKRLDVLAEVLSSRDLYGLFVSPELRRILGHEEPAHEESV